MARTEALQESSKWVGVDVRDLDALQTPEGMDGTLEYLGGKVKIHHCVNTSNEDLERNIRANVAAGRPQVWPHDPQDTVLAICLGGPSLTDHFNEIRRVRDEGGKVVAGANTAKILMDEGIAPHCHVIMDARENNRNFLVPGLNCTYLIASQCHPDVLKALEWSEKVHLFHALNSGGKSQAIADAYPDGWIPIMGGPTLGTRIFHLFDVLGYHRFEVFGFDSCYMEDKHHAYDQPAADEHDAIDIELYGKRFKVSGWMFAQMMEFQKVVEKMGDNWEMVVHGDGLIATLVRGK